MKRDVIVSIDCNAYTCGKCQWVERGFMRRYCRLYIDKEGEPEELMVKGELGDEEIKTLRCEQCFKGELRP